MISYVEGDATQPIGVGPKIICHVCNDIGAWGAGFVLAVSKRWSAPETEYHLAHYHQAVGGRSPLGRVQIVQVAPDTFVANMIAQRGVSARRGDIPLRYDALAQCLTIVGEMAEERLATVHMPRIGCGLAGGEWPRVEELIERHLSGCAVYVYDLPKGTI